MSAQGLKDQLLTPEKRPAVIGDCEKVIDEEVASKSGLSGLAVKAAFGMVKAVKPGIVRESVDGLLDDFVGRMEPFYTDFKAKGAGSTLEQYFTRRSSEVADALLGITDARAQRAKNATLKKAYEQLRPKGKQYVQDAMPRVARMVGRHVGA